MSKTLYPPSEKPIFAVPNPTPAQVQAIFDWAVANGAEALFKPKHTTYWKYFGIDTDCETYWSDSKDDFKNNIITFAEFAELAGVEVVE